MNSNRSLLNCNSTAHRCENRHPQNQRFLWNVRSCTFDRLLFFVRPTVGPLSWFFQGVFPAPKKTVVQDLFHVVGCAFGVA
eukprot:GSChrysophyteH1.ASY1.ANO1.2650.1 assembled CDS